MKIKSFVKMIILMIPICYFEWQRRQRKSDIQKAYTIAYEHLLQILILICRGMRTFDRQV